MEGYRRLLLANKAWVKEKETVDPNFFRKFEQGQKPDYLWIGCSDSRVPAEEITGTQPGELFVHRNIANLVVHTDFNLMSVLEYAVDVLAVKHVIVCGHYGCGGIQNALSRRHLGLINKWLRHIKDVYRFHTDELTQIDDPEKRVERLVELNVLEQVHNLAETSFIQRAWAREQRPFLHGWVYDVKSGYLKQLIESPPGSPVEAIYSFDFDPTAKK